MTSTVYELVLLPDRYLDEFSLVLRSLVLHEVQRCEFAFAQEKALVPKPLVGFAGITAIQQQQLRDPFLVVVAHQYSVARQHFSTCKVMTAITTA